MTRQRLDRDGEDEEIALVLGGTNGPKLFAATNLVNHQWVWTLSLFMEQLMVLTNSSVAR